MPLPILIQLISYVSNNHQIKYHSTIFQLYYMNKDIMAHNVNFFNHAEGLTYHLKAIDIEHYFLHATFDIPNDFSITTRLDTLLRV